MQRQKLTITLREDVLKQVDRSVDGERIRNRSHAIEYLLSQCLVMPTVQKALILAGGKGTGMKELTATLPKSLLLVGEKTIIEHQIEQLKSAGMRNIVVLLGYQAKKIREHLGNGEKLGVTISYVEQPDREIGTAEALYLAKSLLSGGRFIVFYGDTLAELNIGDFMSYHTEGEVPATVALTTLKYPSPYGVVKLRGEKIVDFTEKPKETETLSRVISAGISCFEQEIFNYISDKPSLSLERDIFPKLAKEEKINGYLFEGKWFDIGTPEVYKKAKLEWGR